MKRRTPLVLLVLGLSVLSGYLLSKASFVGRAGISLFYQQYRFLKTWWQGAGAVFIVLLILLLLQGLAEKKFPKQKANLLHAGMIILSLVGLYFTYYDFRHTLSHRLLGERFHIGAYLFWIGWLIISLSYLTQKKPQPFTHPEIIE